MSEILQENLFFKYTTLDKLEKFVNKQPNTLIQKKEDYFELISEEGILFFYIENDKVIFVGNNLDNPYLIKKFDFNKNEIEINGMNNVKLVFDIDKEGKIFTDNEGNLVNIYNLKMGLVNIFNSKLEEIGKGFKNENGDIVSIKSYGIIEKDLLYKKIKIKNGNTIVILNCISNTTISISLNNTTGELLKEGDNFILLNENKSFISYDKNLKINGAGIFNEGEYIYLTKDFEEYIKGNDTLKIEIKDDKIKIGKNILDINLENGTFIKNLEGNYIKSSGYLFTSYSKKEKTVKGEYPLEKVGNGIIKENEETNDKEYLYITGNNGEIYNGKINYEENYIELDNEYKTKVTFSKSDGRIHNEESTGNYIYIKEKHFYIEYNREFNIEEFEIYNGDNYRKINIRAIKEGIIDITYKDDNIVLELKNHKKVKLTINYDSAICTDEEGNFIYKLNDTFKSYNENLEKVGNGFIKEGKYIYIIGNNGEKIKNIDKINTDNSIIEIKNITLSFNIITGKILTDDEGNYILENNDGTFKFYSQDLSFISMGIINKETGKYEYIKDSEGKIIDGIENIDLKNKTYQFNGLNKTFDLSTMISTEILEGEYIFDNNTYKYDGSNFYLLIGEKEILITDEELIGKIKINIRQEELKEDLDKIIPE